LTFALRLLAVGRQRAGRHCGLRWRRRARAARGGARGDRRTRVLAGRHPIRWPAQPADARYRLVRIVRCAALRVVRGQPVAAMAHRPRSELVALRATTPPAAWRRQLPGHDRRGGYYTYLVDVFVPGTGIVRNRVTDPYSPSA
jgi:hypothetical protein